MTSTIADPSEGFGIDTIAVLLPAIRSDCLVVETPGARVFASRAGGLRVEASLPNWACGTNVYPLPVGDVIAVASDLVEAVCYANRIGCPPIERLKVSRLDVVRDFRGAPADVTPLLRALGEMPNRGHGVAARYAKHGTLQTVQVGPKSSWLLRAYDKSAECPSAPEGMLRVETQFRSPRLRRQWALRNGGTITTIEHITHERVERLAHAAFDDAGFGMQFEPRERMLERIDAADLSGARKQTLLGYLVGQPNGYVWLSERSRQEYERLARRLGVRDLAQLVDGSLSLDWVHGRVVRRLADSAGDDVC